MSHKSRRRNLLIIIGLGVIALTVVALWFWLGETSLEHLRTANLLLDEGFLEEARLEFEQALKLEPENYEAAEGLLATLAGTYQLANYSERLISARDAHAGDPFYDFQLALYHAHREDFHRSGELLEEALKHDLPRDWYSYARGILYAASGQHPEAAEEFTKAVDINPALGSAYVRLADTYIGLGELERARAILGEGIRGAAAETYRLRPRLAWLNISEGNFTAALELLPEILEDGATVPGCFYAAAGIALNLELPEDFISELELPELDIENDDEPVSLSSTDHWALAACQQALETDPVPARACYHRALVFYQLGDEATATAELKNAAALAEPDSWYADASVELARWRGLDLLRGGEYAEARESLNTVLRSRERDSEALYNIGLTWEWEGEQQEAITSYKKVIEAVPDDPRAYAGLARIYMIIGEFREAVLHAEEAVTRNPSDRTTRRLLARAYIATRRFDEAEAVLDILTLSAADDQETILLTAKLSSARGRINETIAAYTEALELGGPARTIAEINNALARLYRTLAEEATRRDERKQLLERAEYYGEAGSGFVSSQS
jgi:tetratricopeptide (TPR) repeat protein